LRPTRKSDIEIPSPEADSLVERATKGDVDAFAELFEVTFSSVYRFLYGRCGDPSLAEDLAQDTYMRAMRAVTKSFQGRSSEFVAWIIRIARNRFFDHVKSGRVKWEVVVDEMPVTEASGSEGDPLAAIESVWLRRVLERLTEEQQEIVYMRFFHGLGIAETAKVTGKSEGAVKALQFRALRAMERQLRLEQELEEARDRPGQPLPEGGQ
jgi:RNA polymerase sigma-70 factor, ECF subfamily